MVGIPEIKEFSASVDIIDGPERQKLPQKVAVHNDFPVYFRLAMIIHSNAIPMRSITFSVSMLLFFLGMTAGVAQTPLYEEDFESTYVTSIANDGDDTLRNGTSWCTVAGRGDASIHNSTNVDFRSAQNSTSFAALNPEDSCGGFNSALMESDTFNFSSADTLYFSCRYFISDTIGMGAPVIEITFNNNSTTFKIDSQFTDTARWSSVLVQLPDTMIDDTVWMSADIGGGEAVGLDDLKVTDYPVDTSGGGTGIQSSDLRHFGKLYPNPADSYVYYQRSGELREGMIRIYRPDGAEVKQQPLSSDRKVRVDMESLTSGLYIIDVRKEGQPPETYRVLKR